MSLSFNGDKSKFKAYMRTKIAEALETSAATSKGLCGELLTAAEYVVYFPGEVPYVRPIDPGATPPVIGFQAPTVAQSTAHSIDSKLWHYLRIERDKFNAALSTFKTKFLSELDPATKAMMEDATVGTMQITILEIRQRLILAFGILSPVDRTILFKAALAPYPGGDMRAWQNARNLLFAELAETGEVFSIQTKLRWLLESCTGHFETTIELWEGTYPTTMAQVVHANELYEALIMAYVKNQTQPANLVTAGTRHTMNNISTEEETKKGFKAGYAEGVAFAMATKGGTGVCEICKAKVTDKNKGGILYRWCTVCFEKVKTDRVAKSTARKTHHTA